MAMYVPYTFSEKRSVTRALFRTIMQIENIKIKNLIPYEKNPRKNDSAVEYVAASIREFGFKVPCIVDKDNVLITGHTRLKAAKMLGYTEVPCLRADDLTPDQVKAFRLADNKVAEKADWDFDLLNEEIDGIEMDLEPFGFEFEIDYEPDYAEETQDKVENILNLGKAQFKGVGKYDIPEIKPVKKLPEITEWIGFNYVLSDTSTDEEKAHKGVHFFIDDYQFERVWNSPDVYMPKLAKYGVVASPDFSPYGDMPMATQIYNHYRKHWVGAYMQSMGIRVKPTIRCSSDDRSLEWFLDGEPKNGIILISTMWATQSKEMLQKDIQAYELIKNTLNPKQVIAYGSPVAEFTGNIKYIKSFSQNRWGK